MNHACRALAWGVAALSVGLLLSCASQGESAAPAGGAAWTPDSVGTAWRLQAAQPADPAQYRRQPVEAMTVFAFGHAEPGEELAPIYGIRPELNVRGVLKFGTVGLRKESYDFGLVGKYHALGMAYMGGVSTTAISKSEFADPRQFEDFAMRDSNNRIVDWSEFLGPGMYRGNIANPAFREYIVGFAKFQIDGGVDGIHFDEVDIANTAGPARDWSHDSGFDDWSLADFNRYLLAKYPAFGPEDWRKRFGMDKDNYPRADLPADDLVRNFNYRRYLAAHGWNRPSHADGPLCAANPLAREWGKPVAGRMYRSDSFLGTYIPRYWKAIVDATREYARTRYGKEILITNNGIAPYVDFANVGLWDANSDGPGWTMVEWMPTAGGLLDGSKSLKDAFLYIKQKCRETAGGVPAVLFIDFPTPMMERWFKLPLSQRKDYWRIYGAEAYACGLYWAFPLKETMPGYLDAEQLGLTEFFRDYGNFYRQNAELYHGTELNPVAVGVSAARVSAVVQDIATARRSVVHLVNHNYRTGLVACGPLEVSLPCVRQPARVDMVSPDRAGRSALDWRVDDGVLKVTVPLLESYDAIVVQYQD